MEPGVYGGIGNEEYHKGPGLSSSDLKLLARSPLHYKTAKAFHLEETNAMRLGTAVHCAILEPDRIDVEYVLAPEGIDRRTKAGKAQWAELEATGKTILSCEEAQVVQGMVESVRMHPTASKLFTGGIAEHSCYWTQTVYYADTSTEILCKCRPDYMKDIANGYVIVDLKTTLDAREKAFQRRAYWDLGYHLSAAHYVTGLTEIRGIPPQAFIFVAVEKDPPYAVNVFQAGRDFLDEGWAEVEELYKVYAACMASGEWPGYPDVIRELNLPRGAERRLRYVGGESGSQHYGDSDVIDV